MMNRGHDYLKRSVDIKVIESGVQFDMGMGNARTSMHEILGSNRTELEMNFNTK